MKIFQKIIVFLVIISLLVNPIFNILTLQPKKVKALDGGGAIMLFLKEIGLDLISAFLRDVVIKNLEQKVMDWGAGKTSDANEPLWVVDWTEFFHKTLDYASAKFVQDFHLTSYCSPIQLSLGSRFQLTTYYLDRPTYPMVAACTLDQIVGNVENFMRNPQISVYGMDAWRSLTQPQNNILGSYFLAQERLEQIEEEEDRAADKETAVGGYKNETAATKTDVDACKEGCLDKYNYCITQKDIEQCDAEYTSCENACENLPGVVVEKTVKNLGSQIYGRIEKTLDTHIERIISVEEITELVSIFFTALINKAVNGMGLVFNSLLANKTDRQRADQKDNYAYRREFQKTLTPTITKGARTQVLTTILKSIQQLNRSIIACKEAEMIPYDDWTKNVADIVENNVEALYVGLSGANLKPDFEVLDPVFAPYTTYGYSWGETPSSKIPDKCRTVIEQYYTSTGLSETAAKSAAIRSTCQNVVSELEPPTPTLTDLQADGTTTWTTNPTESCSRCMYDHDHMNCPPGPYPPQPYPTTDPPPEIWTDLIHSQKDEFWWWCKSTYNTTISRCDDCLKKADEKCQQQDQAQKEACITGVCNNYSDLTEINVVPTDPLDFYAKCLIIEQKEACFTCLSEYYVPAYICTDVFDYTSRSIMKYPAVVKRVRAGGDDKGEIWGPAQQDILGRGDQCDDNYDAQPLNLSLLCRIMPDYGNGLCRTCMARGMTEEQLLDITDFRPNDLDCNWATTAGGGRNPWNPVGDGVRRVKGKCCAAASVHDRTLYTSCVGGGTGEEPEGLCKSAGKWWLKPQCWCDQGQRPFGEASTSYPKPLLCCPTADRDCYGAKDFTNSPTCRKACANLEFEVPNMNKRNLTTVKTNPAPGGSVITISAQKCASSGDACNFSGMSNPSLYKRLAKVFKKIMPYALAAAECECKDPSDCVTKYGGTLPDWNCNEFAIPPCIGIEYTGICEETGGGGGGNCDCSATVPCTTPGEVCDTTAGDNGDCTINGSLNGLCIAGGGLGCDPDTCIPSYSGYVGSAPSPINDTCQITAHRSNGAEACCTDGPQDRTGVGANVMTCNLGGVSPGTKLFLSVTSDQLEDCKTAAALCIPCDPSDPGYPSYGIKDPKTGAPIDQCNNKIPEALR